ncbi:HIG1 domain family member 1C-like [Argiope bruennichi]|uniref:HIG1 domain family member 1C like protein n=1 Tax=Argiope bruennichi TaxID=94029 RepID=A0A8T0F344_ARGBR|nr:HIG1 domain family member 1C-like [Argiope bruennichi]KAF8783338.1 HIG1 domain family member 1C like protein [Argiope bruennichi]
MTVNQPPQFEKPELNFESESTVQKLARKTKDSPLMVAGLSSFFIIAGYGIYKFRNRGKLSASNYLMQLRVTAQGAVITCLTVGVLKSLYDRFNRKSE